MWLLNRTSLESLPPLSFLLAHQWIPPSCMSMPRLHIAYPRTQSMSFTIQIFIHLSSQELFLPAACLFILVTLNTSFYCNTQVNSAFLWKAFHKSLKSPQQWYSYVHKPLYRDSELCAWVFTKRHEVMPWAFRDMGLYAAWAFTERHGAVLMSLHIEIWN